MRAVEKSNQFRSMADREYTIRITTVANPSGLKDISAANREVGRSGTQAFGEIAGAVENAELKHKDLHAGIRALREEFPGLAHAAHFFLNPVGLAVAGITSAFALWHKRIEGLVQALAGLELPKASEREVGHITAMAEAWEKLGNAVKKAADGYSSVDSASDRAIAKVKAQLDQDKKLRAALGIGGDFEAEQNADMQSFYLRARRATDLKVDSDAKMREAGGIHIASAEDDTKTEADLKAQAVAAKKRIEEGQKRLGQLDDYQSGNMGRWERLAYSASYIANYGIDASPQDVRELEGQGIANAQPPIDRYNAFLRSKAERKKLQQRRTELTESAASEAAEAATLDAAFPDDLAAFQKKRAAETTVHNLSTNPLTAGASGDMQAAEATAAALQQHKAVSDESKEQLVQIASSVAGHQVSLQTAVAMMQVAAQNMAVFVSDVVRLASAMASLSGRVDDIQSRSQNGTRTLPGGNP